MSNEFLRYSLNINRRTFLSRTSVGIGSLALGSLLVPDLFSGKNKDEDALPFGVTHFAPKAKRVIYLFQSGAPSFISNVPSFVKYCDSPESMIPSA